MKILHINTYEAGGAGKACVRLHENLLKQGLDSNLLVLHRAKSTVPNIYSFFDFYKPTKLPFLRKVINKISGLFADTKSHEEHIANRPPGYESFTSVRTSYDITGHPLYRDSDIVHFHWVGDFVDFKSFFRHNKKKIIWTMQDMNPLTGGCHYSSGCDRFKTDCHDCPQLQGTIDTDYARRNLKLKKNSLTRTDIHLAASSHWLIGLSKTSYLFSDRPHTMIYNGSDATVFDPIEKKLARAHFGLPQDKIIVLFIANLDNQRKGYYYVQEAWKAFSGRNDIFLCIAGESKNPAAEIPNSKFLGKISDEKTLNAFYSAGDVLLIPSLEDDLPNTIIESFLCGTPVIGFPVGGISEMILKGINGYLCMEIGVKPLVDKVNDFLSNKNIFNRSQIRNEAIRKFSVDLQVKNYIELYKRYLVN
jgi:glycosyltransferase involved in cell wall biosynthesis